MTETVSKTVVKCHRIIDLLLMFNGRLYEVYIKVTIQLIFHNIFMLKQLFSFTSFHTSYIESIVITNQQLIEMIGCSELTMHQL